MVIVYELNEVPPRLLDYYIHLRPDSAMATIARLNTYKVTHTYDNGELHPWSTWPTVHRGVPNHVHDIRFINQDLQRANEKYPPIWELLRRRGVRIGIFGSLQSYPPPKSTTSVNFYIPDTFSPDDEAFPNLGRIFQKFNLALAGRNKAVSASLSKRDVVRFFRALLGGSIRFSGLYKCTKQVFMEVFDRRWKARRPFVQAILGFDLYLRLLDNSKLGYSSFFTNHVAAVMHKYWRDLFPNDFSPGSSHNHPNKFNAETIIKAMDIADHQISLLLSRCQSLKADLWVISSMGQKAIERGDYVPETILVNPARLLDMLGLSELDHRVLPAMQPDVCIKSHSCQDQAVLRRQLKSLTDTSGCQLLIEKYDPQGLTLNVSLQTSKYLADNGKVMFNGQTSDASLFGLSTVAREQGTAYHTPEGIFLAAGPNEHYFARDAVVPTSSFKNIILRIFGFSN